jgi:glutamate-1-semialdehyde 2,1-aminomutase
MPLISLTLADHERRAADALQDQLPKELFDAHSHLFSTDTMSQPPALLEDLDREGTVAVWQDAIGQLVGENRLIGGLLLAFPTTPDAVDATNRHLLQQLQGHEHCRCSLIVAPSMEPGALATLADHPQVAGLKPYHLLGSHQPTWDAPIDAYLPEWAWQLADKLGLTITLHLVRTGAVADGENQRTIIEKTQRYPNAKVILAHAARCFHAPNASGLAALRERPNVWFDSSAICEVEPLLAILDTFGPRKLMWGSDFPIAFQRARAVTVGEGFAFVGPDHVDGENTPAAELLPNGVEAIRALLRACNIYGLNNDDRRDIFADNARRLLGLLDEPADRTQALYRHARERMPGGTQLLSKRPELQAPDQWPAYCREARGCEVWDLDGRHYYDFSMTGIASTLLGYRDPDVTAAVRRRINLGSQCTQNYPEEVDLAEKLCQLHPWAESVRIGRLGGEMAAIAVRIARATTDRSKVAVCGYHGWHDWYLAANLGEDDSLRGHLLPGLEPLGVPRQLRGTTHPFRYNDRDAFSEIIEEHGEDLAAVVMEPCRHNLPEEGFLEFIRDEAHRVGAMLIFDEISIGWRLTNGGAHLRLGVNPDMAIFAKALGNGHPIAAVIGTADAMDGANDTFISSTYWTEGVGPAAALATLEKIEAVNAVHAVQQIGERIQAVIREAATSAGLDIEIKGWPSLFHLAFNHEKPQALRTLYTQQMLRRGFLAGASLYPNLAHSDRAIIQFQSALQEVFPLLADAVDKGDIDDRLTGPVAHSGFQRLL